MCGLIIVTGIVLFGISVPVDRIMRYGKENELYED